MKFIKFLRGLFSWFLNLRAFVVFDFDWEHNFQSGGQGLVFKLKSINSCKERVVAISLGLGEKVDRLVGTVYPTNQVINKHNVLRMSHNAVEDIMIVFPTVKGELEELLEGLCCRRMTVFVKTDEKQFRIALTDEISDYIKDRVIEMIDGFPHY